MARRRVVVSFAFCCLGVFAFGSSSDTVEIAPGVSMPLMNLGGVENLPSNYSLWLGLGGRGLDTAYEYGVEVQTSVGRAVHDSRVPRSNIFITTKVPCCPDNILHNYGCAGFLGTSPQEVVRMATAADLEQLGVDVVDLLLLHVPCNSLEETVQAYSALEDALASGQARAIGVSNFNASVLEAFLPRVSVKPAVNQCGFSIGGHNMTWRGQDLETLKRCQDSGITFSAFSPLGGLSGIDIFHNPVVLEVAQAHGKSAAQVALRWVVQQGIPAVTASVSADHDRSDLDVFNFELSDVEMSALTAVGQMSTSIVV